MFCEQLLKDIWKVSGSSGCDFESRRFQAQARPRWKNLESLLGASKAAQIAG